MSFKIKENDTTPSLRASLLNGSGDPVDLLGTTVRFYMRLMGSNSTTIDASASVISEANGIVQYDWVDGDTADVGSYQAEFEVTYLRWQHRNLSQRKLHWRRDNRRHFIGVY